MDKVEKALVKLGAMIQCEELSYKAICEGYEESTDILLRNIYLARQYSKEEHIEQLKELEATLNDIK